MLQFMKFMRQIGEGEVIIENGEVVGDVASSWLEDYKHEVFDDKWKEANATVRKEGTPEYKSHILR